MVPPFGRYTTAQILNALGTGHHWVLGELGILVGVVFFLLGAAVTTTAVTTKRADKPTAEESYDSQRHIS